MGICRLEIKHFAAISAMLRNGVEAKREVRSLY